MFVNACVKCAFMKKKKVVLTYLSLFVDTPGCVLSLGTQGHEKESESYVFLYYDNSTRLEVINV